MADIFTYIDYRQFLKDFYAVKKESNPSFSIRNFSRMAGLGGQSYLKMIMNGDRNLTVETVTRFIKAMGLKKKESAYFEALVFYNQAKTPENKSYYFQKLLKLKPVQKYHQLQKDSLEFFSNRFLPIIREMVTLSDFKEDPVWMAQCLHNRNVTPQKIKAAIEALLRLGLLVRDKKGILRQHQGTLASLPDESSLEICNFHRSVQANAMDAIFETHHNLREIITITVPVPQDLLPEMKEILRQCRDDLLALINKSKKKFDEVYHINLQFFPVTRHPDKTPRL